MALLDDLTQALRADSPELLAAAIGRCLHAQPSPLPDRRDLLVALAPMYDCAVRLGLDPQELFDLAIHGRSDEITEIVQTFARRADITPEAFDFMVEDTPEGPRYRWRSI